MRPAQFDPRHLEGRPFLLRDLLLATAWAASRPSLQLRIVLGYRDISEVIEIYPPTFASPRWLLWNTFEGRLQVDDLAKVEFGLPYLTVSTALGFIDSEL
jgi:hypothetical protein